MVRALDEVFPRIHCNTARFRSMPGAIAHHHRKGERRRRKRIVSLPTKQQLERRWFWIWLFSPPPLHPTFGIPFLLLPPSFLRWFFFLLCLVCACVQAWLLVCCSSIPSRPRPFSTFAEGKKIFRSLSPLFRAHLPELFHFLCDRRRSSDDCLHHILLPFPSICMPSCNNAVVRYRYV